MNTVKMGVTIEEATECTGIGRNTMQSLMMRMQDRTREIRSLQEEVPKLKTQLAEWERKGREKGKPTTWNDSFHIENNTAGFLWCIHKECAPWFPSTGRMVIWIYLLYFLLRL